MYKNSRAAQSRLASLPLAAKSQQDLHIWKADDSRSGNLRITEGESATLHPRPHFHTGRSSRKSARREPYPWEGSGHRGHQSKVQFDSQDTPQ